MFELARRWSAVLALGACVALLASGCASGSSSGSDADEPIDEDRGRQAFQQSCRVCHSLADADAAGTFGPDLDALQPDAERVREQIESGGGGMPADVLEGAQADLVARYVAQVAGRGAAEEAPPGSRGGAKPSTG